MKRKIEPCIAVPMDGKQPAIGVGAVFNVPAEPPKPTLIATRRYKAGYVVRTEEYPPEAYGTGAPFRMKSAYTPDGAYIGDQRTAHRLVVKRGIAPQLSSADHRVCSIGYCAKELKWYGWSHRAIYGFKVGDVVKEGDCTAMSGWTDECLRQHPERDVSLPVGFKAKTLEDAKRMARAIGRYNHCS